MGFPSMGYLKMDENPMNMDDLGVPVIGYGCVHTYLYLSSFPPKLADPPICCHARQHSPEHRHCSDFQSALNMFPCASWHVEQTWALIMFGWLRQTTICGFGGQSGFVPRYHMVGDAKNDDYCCCYHCCYYPVNKRTCCGSHSTSLTWLRVCL